MASFRWAGLKGQLEPRITGGLQGSCPKPQWEQTLTAGSQGVPGILNPMKEAASCLFPAYRHHPFRQPPEGDAEAYNQFCRCSLAKPPMKPYFMALEQETRFKATFSHRSSRDDWASFTLSPQLTQTVWKKRLQVLKYQCILTKSIKYL